MITRPLKNSLSFILVASCIYLTVACSSESSAPLSKAFHNTTARYNAYFIGLERINQVEEAIWKAMKPDYNFVLMVYPPLDSTMANTYKTELEDCIKKASIVIQYHQNSKWVDDSYNLIGRARMYGYDFPNAITTFKYVNTTGKNVNAKHWAIVNLMRTFVENNEFANAIEASDYLESEILDKNNLKHLYLTRAYYYQKIDDKDRMVRNLVRADPLLTKTERARFYFIIAQVYQEIGFSSSAYDYYRKCIASNPEYELSFYAKLNIAQVTELSVTRDLKKVRKYFKKLARDEKNIEFQDRIYYEWARFEIKQNNLDEAIDKFNQSIQASVNDPRQKGVSYLSLGEIYYDTLLDYPMAQAYYDSAVSILPKTYEHYQSVKHRQEVLTDFITQINTINLQDSLLRLVEMDSVDVMSLFITKATTDQNAVEEELALVKKQERNQVGSLGRFDQPTGVGTSNWYFSNIAAVSAGRTSFRQTWGTRELGDHWRRSIKLTVATNDENILDDEAKEDGGEMEDKISRDEIIMVSAVAMYGQLPFSDTEKESAHEALERAHYKLGKIYYFDLEEKANAISSFNALHEGYPQSEFSAETYYLLYLIYRDIENTIEAEKVVIYMHAEMPNSVYTKIIDNPNYEELSDQANEVLTAAYKEVYELYTIDSLDSANQIIVNLLSKYPDVNFSANLKLLQILIIGKRESLADYQLALKSFIELHPDHELNGYAVELLAASKAYKSSLVKLRAAEYFYNTTEEYYFVVLSTINMAGDQNEELLAPIIKSNLKGKDIDIGSLELSDSISMTVVQPFANKDDALLFYDIIKAEQIFDAVGNPSFVISVSNFDILYKSKEIEAYLEFYRDHF